MPIVIEGWLFPLLMLIIIIIALVAQTIYVNSADVRNNILFNSVGAIIVAIGFIILVFKFMGEYVTILGTQIDMGLILYIFIAIFVIFVLGG